MRAIDANLLVCPECHQLDRLRSGCLYQHCKRCGARVSIRRRHALSKTWALLVTAMLMYFPANLLPIMTVRNLGQGTPDTIMSGVISLAKQDMLAIAIIVFLASILVPTFKLIGIAALLISIQKKIQFSPRQRVIIFRFIEWIGRWSMLDIFVIAVLVAVVNFGNLANVEAGFGAIAFAGVVILTMLAAITFDPRLIWDNTED